MKKFLKDITVQSIAGWIVINLPLLGGTGIIATLGAWFAHSSSYFSDPLIVFLSFLLSAFLSVWLVVGWKSFRCAKIENLPTYVKIKLENNSIECGEAKNVTYRYLLSAFRKEDGTVLGNKIDFVCFFHEKIMTDSIMVKAINGTKPIYSTHYYQHDGCWITFENIRDGEYLIEFNHIEA